MRQSPNTLTEHPEPPRAGIDDRIAHAQADLAQLKNQLRQSQRLASLGTAAAILAHEFNNVMTPVVGYAKFALGENDPQLMTKALEITLKQTETALAMSERILGLAVEEPAAFSLVPLKELIESAIKALCRDLGKDGIAITVDVDSALTVRADPRQLRGVFFNLLINARDALAKRGGRITFKALATDDTVMITVSDNGCGIAPDHLGAIFDPFFTTKGSNENGTRRGFGLGLCLCRDVIEEHRGSITVQSEPSRGTTFTISLPSAR